MTMRMPGGLLLALPLLAATHAHADACETASDQASLNACAQEAFAEADADLNAAYGEIRARLADDPDARALLMASQRAWIAFRDAECGFRASGVAGGSVQPMIVSDCMAELTHARADQLADYLDCEEGDMSCPVPPAP